MAPTVVKSGMRWKFTDSRDDAEREEVLARIDAWWRSFSAQASRMSTLFSPQGAEELVQWTNQGMESIHPQLMWEYGSGLKHPKGRRLVISPERRHHLRPLVEDIIARAPVLPDWEFYPWRPPEDLPMVMQTVHGLAGVDFSSFQALVSDNDDGTVNITYTPRSWLARLNPFRRWDDDATQLAAVIATGGLLGEERLHTRVRLIRVEPRGRGVPLETLAAEVDRRLHEWRERLPDQPFHLVKKEDSWSTFRFEPIPQADYALRLDLLTASTLTPALFSAAHSSMPFSSERFSRHGETFCYLKMDGAEEGFDVDDFSDRALVDALNEALVPAQLGCVIGGGKGLRYLYLDLCLMDVKRALPRLQEVVRRGKAPRRTWLLFFDSALEEEWLPLWEDTPPPPRIESTAH